LTVYPEALAEHLAREITTACHCWRLVRPDGVVSGFTDHDRPLTVDGTLFEPGTGFSASEARDTLGLAVDTVDVEGALSSATISEAEIADGLYDRATVETLLVNWRAPQDFAVLRKATIGKITRSDGRFVAELESLAHALDRPNGRYVTRACDAELGDARCGVLLDHPDYTGAGAVLSVETAKTAAVSGLDGFASGWFSHGTIQWTTGARAGRSEFIVGHRKEAGSVTLTLRPGGGPPVGVGDAFTAKAGCGKTFATCKAKFANALNFRGFPHLPGNDAAYNYVADGGKFDGGPVVP
jgi:uncharacterized phage protein (TIGR02218 family)